MIDLVESFATAFRLQQDGRLIEAETLYRAILGEAPQHAGSQRHCNRSSRRSRSMTPSPITITISARSIAASDASRKRSRAIATRSR